MRSRTVVAVVMLMLRGPGLALAQDSTGVPVALPGAGSSQPFQLQWWHGVAALGGVAAISLLDEPGNRFFQDHRSNTTDDISSVFRHMGQPEVWATVPVAMLGIGLIAHDDQLVKSGSRVGVSLLLAAAVSTGTKFVLGRYRPNESSSAYEFSPFSGHESFPSGHTTMAFALASSLSDEIHRDWVTALLYSAATGTAYSRLNDEKHWVSDVVGGALVGITSTKLVNGRWQLFHIRPPRFLVGRGIAAVSWSARF
jgi:membrane-associated phospholipid phosphatase